MKNLIEIKRDRISMWDAHSQTGHTALLGKSGYGKGVGGQTLCEQAHLQGKKVLVWDMFRAENVFYGFPEDNPEMLEHIYKTNRKPKGHKTEILCPIFARGKGKREYTLPSSWIPVKIAYKNLTTAELNYLMGATTEKADQIFDAIDFNVFKSLTQLQVKFLQLQSKKDQLLIIDNETGESADIGDPRIYKTINRAIGALIKKGIVYTEVPKGFQSIDVEKIQKNTDTITAITGRYAGTIENFLTVFFNVMSQIINSRQKESGKYAPMVIYIPEVSNIAGATEKNSSVRNLMRFILQEGRDAGIEVIIDTQKPQNIDASVKSQITKWYIFNLNREDVDYMDKNLVDITDEYNVRDEIPKQGIGTCVKLWQDRSYRWRFRKAAKMNVPTSHKKKAYEDVNIYFKIHGIDLVNIIEDGSQSGITTGFASMINQSEEVEGDSSW